MQKQISHIDLSFIEQNMTKYVVNRAKYNVWRSTKHKSTEISGVLDGSVAYSVIDGRCECGIGKESGIPCSHEIFLV